MGLLWFNPSWQISTAQLLAPSGMGERIGRVKVRKLVGWDKDSLKRGKAKAVHTSKAKPGIHSPLPMGRQVFSHLQESRAPSRVMGSWEDKHHNSKHPSLPSSSPSFIGWAWRHIAWNIPWVSWGQLSQLCPLPTPCAPPACSLVAWGEEQKSPWRCASTVQQ